MSQKPNMWDLSPEGLRAYALARRDGEAHLAYVGARCRDVFNSDAVALVIEIVRQNWRFESEVAEGFADRLEIGPVATPERDTFPLATETAAELEALLPSASNPEPIPSDFATSEQILGFRQVPDQRWYRVLGFSERFATLAEAMEASGWEPIAIQSSEWAGTRWAIRVPTDDGTDEIATAETEEEARSYLAADSADAEASFRAPTEEEMRNPGLADAVAEALANPPPAKPEAEPTQVGRAQRSDSPWTAERLALLRRLFPTIIHQDRLLGLLNALPGLPIPSANAVAIKARKLDLHRRGEPVPEEYAGTPASRSRQPQMAEAAKPTPLAEPIKPSPMMLPEDMAEAREKLRTGEFKGAKAIVDYYGCTQDEAQALVDAHRAALAARRAA